MNTIYKPSQASVIPLSPVQRFVYVLDSENPETVLAGAVRDFMESIGFSSMFPNFDNIRVGTIHPFAILIAQEVLGKAQAANLFPSITVADSSIDEGPEVLSDSYDAVVFTPADIAALSGHRDAKQVYASDAGWAKIMSTLQSKGHVVGVKKSFYSTHSIDFNIWSENKDVTSFMFDMMCHFIVQERTTISNSFGIDMFKLGGRRSGDINLDFGRLLHGSNVRIQASMGHTSVVFDTVISSIAEVDVKTLPQYFTVGGSNV